LIKHVFGSLEASGKPYRQPMLGLIEVAALKRVFSQTGRGDLCEFRPTVTR
jgi:hypothetical protein